MSNRTLTFLGTGTSVGIPMVGCDCAVCLSSNPRNHRYRCSVCIQLPQGNILIDTTPELRLQLVRARIQRLEAVIYTHYHVDHLFGLDDLRPFAKYREGPMPVYCTEEVEHVIRRVFSYAFPKEPRDVNTYVPQLDLRRISGLPFAVLGETFTPIPLKHARFNVLGFRVGNLAYCTDLSEIPPESWPLLEGLDILILDALRFKPHPAHLSIPEAVEIIQKLRPRQAFLTHMSHDVEHEETNRQLPPGIQLAYDGLELAF